MIVTGSQIRAARGLLGWTQARLAQASGLHPNAVAYWGHKDIPTGVWREPVACRRIRKALLEAGVEFLQLPLLGVRLVARHNNAPSTRRRARAHHGVLRSLRPQKCKTYVIPVQAVSARGPATACAAEPRTRKPCAYTSPPTTAARIAKDAIAANICTFVFISISPSSPEAARDLGMSGRASSLGGGPTPNGHSHPK